MSDAKLLQYKHNSQAGSKIITFIENSNHHISRCSVTQIGKNVFKQINATDSTDILS